MKKYPFVLMVLLAAAGLFALGWFLGQQSVIKPASKVTNNLMFDFAYNRIIDNDMIVKCIDTGHLEDAKQSLYLRLDGSILMLKHQLEETNAELSASDMKTLLRIDGDGPRETDANIAIARVAKYRQEHPWKYSGEHPHEISPEAAAKL